MINVLRSKCRNMFSKECKELGIYLTRFDGETGIIKCNHIEKEKTIDLLKSIKKISSRKIEIETLGTSGTIKALEKKHLN